MLDQLRRFFGSFDPQGGLVGEADDPRVAAAALLVHVANADGAFTTVEKQRLEALLAREFSIGAAEAAALVEDGRRADRDAIDLFGFTSVLMNRMEEEERVRFVDLVWSMIYADDELHELEDNLAWRISELLGVSGRDRMLAKQAARRRSAAVE